MLTDLRDAAMGTRSWMVVTIVAGVADNGEVRVNSAALVSHAGAVDRVADGLTTAGRAGEAVRTGTGAYGVLCHFVPVLLNGLQQAVVDGMTTAAGSVHDTADRLRSVAAAYDAADGNALDRLRSTRARG
jgi:Excreted virulence factor EspC, type VII ESX diderm